MFATHLLIYTLGVAICMAAIYLAAIGLIFPGSVRTRLEIASIVAVGAVGVGLCVHEVAALALL